MVAKRYGQGGKRTENRLKRILAVEREGNEGAAKRGRGRAATRQMKGPIERSRGAGGDKQENN